ncbi:MAG: hypothetical protein ACQEW5_28425 [Bacillota bacterium]
MLTFKRFTTYQFVENQETGGVRMYDNMGVEANPDEIAELIEGLSKEYLTLTAEEKSQRMISSFEDEFQTIFLSQEKPYTRKEFRKDMKRDWSFKCVNCKEKISSKTHEEYYYADECVDDWHGLRFCSEWCAEKYHSELKAQYVKKRKVEYGL